MALKVNQISATDLLHIVRPDFTKNKWDGCLRMSHQFIPFLQKLFDTAGVSYCLELTPANEPRIPYLERPDLAYDVRPELITSSIGRDPTLNPVGGSAPDCPPGSPQC